MCQIQATGFQVPSVDSLVARESVKSRQRIFSKTMTNISSDFISDGVDPQGVTFIQTDFDNSKIARALCF